MPPAEHPLRLGLPERAIRAALADPLRDVHEIELDDSLVHELVVCARMDLTVETALPTAFTAYVHGLAALLRHKPNSELWRDIGARFGNKPRAKDVSHDEAAMAQAADRRLQDALIAISRRNPMGDLYNLCTGVLYDIGMAQLVVKVPNQALADAFEAKLNLGKNIPETIESWEPSKGNYFPRFNKRIKDRFIDAYRACRKHNNTLSIDAAGGEAESARALLDTLPGTGNTIADIANREGQGRVNDLLRCIRTRNEVSYIIILRHYCDGWDWQPVADALGRNANTVRNSLNERAKRDFWDCYRELNADRGTGTAYAANSTT